MYPIAGPQPQPRVDEPEVDARVRLQFKQVLAIIAALGLGAGGASFAVSPSADEERARELEHRLTRIEVRLDHVVSAVEELLQRSRNAGEHAQ